METIILASDSPRRKEYFRLLGLPFKAIPSPVEEIMDISKDAKTITRELATTKVDSVKKLLTGQEAWIIGADTLISLEGHIFGKPKARQDALEMLLALSGHTHEVISSIALFNCHNNLTDCRSSTSLVRFALLNEEEVEWYLDTGEWENVAGAYKIQGLAACFIEEIQGSYSGIVGLPLHLLYAMLKDNGYPWGVTEFSTDRPVCAG
ncbi:MAG: Maf family protein [Treponema sp.]|jgi:septum formation protein|nr:Maf family protein [Treponema sp.]